MLIVCECCVAAHHAQVGPAAELLKGDEIDAGNHHPGRPIVASVVGFADCVAEVLVRPPNAQSATAAASFHVAFAIMRF